MILICCLNLRNNSKINESPSRQSFFANHLGWVLTGIVAQFEAIHSQYRIAEQVIIEQFPLAQGTQGGTN
jgi:hypothetical protein